MPQVSIETNIEVFLFYHQMNLLHFALEGVYCIFTKLRQLSVVFLHFS